MFSTRLLFSSVSLAFAILSSATPLTAQVEVVIDDTDVQRAAQAPDEITEFGCSGIMHKVLASKSSLLELFGRPPNPRRKIKPGTSTSVSGTRTRANALTELNGLYATGSHITLQPPRSTYKEGEKRRRSISGMNRKIQISPVSTTNLTRLSEYLSSNSPRVMNFSRSSAASNRNSWISIAG